MRLSLRSFVLLLTLLLTVLIPTPAQRRFQQQDEDTFRFRFVGPSVGNRVASAAGVPGDSTTYYAGAASGGVWKTTDGGNRWFPVFDKEPVQAIGALAVATSDPNVVWAGTGEAWAIRDSDLMGNGVYKSTDAGKTWTHAGLDETGRIGRIIINPTNPDVVFVCALGRLTGPQQERGVYRTMDGGQHWDRVLFADENTGCSGLSMDAHNSRTLFAGMWQVEMHTYAELSGGPGSGVYVTHDGGTKWTRIEAHGMPKPPVGKIDVAVAPTNSNRVFALIQTKDQGSLWRSDDGGENWSAVNYARALIGRAGYYIRIAVSTGNDNEVYISNSDFHESLDAGETFRSVPWGGDNHDIWVDPKDPDRIVVTDDGGINISTVHGRGFNRVQLPIGQMYHVAVDNQVPYYFYTNMQDDGNMRGPSTSFAGFGFGRFGEIGWDHAMGGCESGFTLPDLTDPNVVWATCYGDEVTRWDAKTKQARSISPWYHTIDSPPDKTKYRCHWTPPLAIDPFDHNTVYYGCQVIFKTSDEGQSWKVISPDLSTNDPSRIISSGGLVGDNLGQFYGEVVFAIAPSQIQKGLIWAGTNDGQVWYTKDGGDHWTNVAKNMGSAAWGTVTSIEPSHFDAGTAYVTLDYHLMDNRDPFIYKTSDYGTTWKLISGGLPKHPLAYVRIIAEDPNCKGLLFAGTGNGLYYSLDDGANWTAFAAGLPRTVVSWAVVQKQFHDLVVSTYGRGIYILDDISPLEQMAQQQSDAAVRLFESRPTYRLSRFAGAPITYSVKTEPKDHQVQIEILDQQGTVIRKMKGPGREGMNRVDWDFHYDPPRLVALRTASADNPHIWEERRFRGAESRPITHWGIEDAQVGPMAIPGKYTVRLTVEGQSFTQPLTLLKDPRTISSDADLNETLKTEMRIRDDISGAADMINQIEWTRKQLADVESMLKSRSGESAPKQSDADKKANAELMKSAQDMDKKLQDVEFQLVSRAEVNSDDKYYVEPYRVYLNLIWLNAEVGTGGGDVAGGADFKPTDSDMNVLGLIEKDLAAAKSDYDNLYENDMPAFNRALAEHGVLPLVSANTSDSDEGAIGTE